MSSVNVLRRIGAFLNFFLWSFFGPCILVLLWILVSWHLGSFSLSHNKPIPHPFYSNNFQRGIRFQKSAELGNIHIQVTAIEKRVIAPEEVEDIAAVNDLIPVFV